VVAFWLYKGKRAPGNGNQIWESQTRKLQGSTADMGSDRTASLVAPRAGYFKVELSSRWSRAKPSVFRTSPDQHPVELLGISSTGSEMLLSRPLESNAVTRYLYLVQLTRPVLSNRPLVVTLLNRRVHVPFGSCL
jgi:hypothetical protein